jgi:hypothetical protein
VVVRSLWRKGSGFDLAEDVKVIVIVGWYLGNNISIFGCKQALEMGINGFQVNGVGLAGNGLHDARKENGLWMRWR